MSRARHLVIRAAVARAVAAVAAGSTHAAAAKLEGISLSSLRRALHPPARKAPRAPRAAPPPAPSNVAEIISVTAPVAKPRRPVAPIDAVLLAGLALVEAGRSTAEAALELRRKGHRITWIDLHDARAAARRGEAAYTSRRARALAGAL